MNDKDFLNLTKNYLGGIFSRTMSKFVFGIPGLKDNQVIACNIDWPDAEFFDNSPEFFLHEVTYYDTAWIVEFYTRFPILRKCCALLYADQFQSALNKHVKVLGCFKIWEHNNRLVCGDPNTPEDNKVCGWILTGFLTTRYQEIFNQWKVDTADAIIRPIGKLLQSKGSWYVIDGKDLGEVPELNTRFLMFTNKNTVAAKFAESDGPDVQQDIVIAPEGKTSRINFIYTSESLHVVSVQPGIVWFKTKGTKNG